MCLLDELGKDALISVIRFRWETNTAIIAHQVHLVLEAGNMLAEKMVIA